MRTGLVIIIAILPLGVWAQQPDLKDPTRPINFQTEETEQLTLNAIITPNQGEQPHIAIINGEPSTLGDVVNGFKVITITSNKVVMRKDQQQQTLKMNQYATDIKRKVND